jgi:hypothetical protein
MNAPDLRAPPAFAGSRLDQVALKLRKLRNPMRMRSPVRLMTRPLCLPTIRLRLHHRLLL